MYLDTHSLGHAYKEKWKRGFLTGYLDPTPVLTRNGFLFNWNSLGDSKVYLRLMDAVSIECCLPDASCGLLDKEEKSVSS